MIHRLIFAVFCFALSCNCLGDENEAALTSASTPAIPTNHTAEEELDALMPIPIGERYFEHARKRLIARLARMRSEVDDPAALFDKNELVSRQYSEDLRVMYTVNFPEGGQLVTISMMERWGVDPDRLHQRALANLERATPEFQIKQVTKLPWLHVLDHKDGNNAARILLRWRWAILTLSLGESLVMGIPTRDIVVFTASTNKDQLAQLRETVETLEAHESRPITPKLFQWTPEGWEELEE